MDDYEPIKVLGEGSFGKVYLMKHKDTRDLVCTKVIKLKNIPPKEQEACRNEVDLLRRMCHPNIVGYTNSYLYKNCLCIIMEYCDAGDLGDRVNEAKGRLLPESKVMTWFVQTALGLHYMHTNRVLHRDIKTQNIFILSSGRVVLGDLGISKLLGGTRDFASTCIGTPYYMSPEIFKNHPYNNKSDVWALGCMLYELLTLKHAFDAQSLNGLAGKIIKGKFPSVSNEYSKNLRVLVNDMLATNPRKRPDIEQILRKSFVQTRVKEFVGDLNADALHRQDKAMSALSDQLIDLKMDDAVPLENLIVEEGDEGAEHDGPNAPSPSESGAAANPLGVADSGPRSQFKAQKHQLELEEEKRIAAEMALNRLRRKAAERRRRASLSRSNSPVNDGAGRIGGSGGGGAMSPRTPGSPGSPDDDGGGSLTSRGRRPSLFQRLGNLATSQLGGRRKSLSTPSSPSGADTSQGTGSPRGRRGYGAGNRSVGGGSGGSAGVAGSGLSDVDRAVALAIAAAEEMEGKEEAAVVKGPTGPPQRFLARPKETTDYVSNPSPRRRGSRSGTNVTGNNDGSASPRRDPPPDQGSGGGGHGSPRGSGSGASGGGSSKEKRTSEDTTGSTSPQVRSTPDLPKLKIVGGEAPVTPALRSGRSPAREIDGTSSGREKNFRKSDSLYEEGDNDLFQVLKEQARAHAREGEDQEIHDREEELKAKLREAEQRCLDLQRDMEKAREMGGREEIFRYRRHYSASPVRTPDDWGRAGNAAEGGGAARRGSYSRSNSANSADDDKASDFEDEPVPYCESHLEELQDAPTPVGQLVDRVQFLRKKCTEGLGEKNFEKALALLKAMQEGDCKVTVDNVEYDGNDDDQVEKVLVKVIGKHKLHYWNLMDQLLLMS